MGVIGGLLSFIIGTIVFFLLNQAMDITYLGCGAMASFWFGCVLFSGVGIILLGGFLLGLLKWVIIIAIILVIIGFVASRVNSNQE